MKFITILLTIFALKSCGNQKATANMQDNMEAKQTEILSGKYSITLLGSNKNLPENIHLSFDDTKNTVSGFAGCNRFSGNYSIDGKTLKFGPIVSTKMYCKRFMDIENHVLKALENTNSYHLVNSKLTLQSDDFVLIEAIKNNTDNKALIDKYTIEYSAITRGTYKTISFVDNTLFYSNDRNTKPTARTCNADERAIISKLVNELNLDALATLEAPSKAHQYDGAAGATFSITNNGKTYQTQTFDHGKPHEDIAELVNALMSMSEKQ